MGVGSRVWNSNLGYGTIIAEVEAIRWFRVRFDNGEVLNISPRKIEEVWGV
mgnify:FL=1|tara:strand:- start:76 stop:228 length:153 start_codon:yes stop_codon:yes gene_type:complete